MIPVDHISENSTVSRIATNTKATLRIKSVVTSLGVTFPAFLTDFSQNFEAAWNAEKVYGRMDPIATYQGTTRTVQLGFDIPSADEKDAKTNLSKTQNLVKMVYPVYKNNTLAKPPLVRIQFANLLKSNPPTPLPQKTIKVDNTKKENSKKEEDKSAVLKEDNKAKSVPLDYGVLGWISGLSWKPNLEMGMFSNGNELFPKVISISFTFNILHERTLNQEDEKNLQSWPFGVI